MTSSNTTLFISDLHLDPSQPKITETFFYFLEHIAKEADALYILGDFFESYVGDDNCDNPFMQSIIRALSHAAESGLSIFLMHGNRDFLIGTQFLLSAGVTFLNDPTIITLYNKKVLLMHGDSLCTQDLAHQRFRKIVNNKIIQKLFLLLPLSFRKKMANQLRDESKKQNKYKSMAIMDICEDTVNVEMKKYNVIRLIHGHTHKPAIHQLANGGERIVMGAWHDHGNYLCVRNDGSAALIDV